MSHQAHDSGLTSFHRPSTQRSGHDGAAASGNAYVQGNVPVSRPSPLIYPSPSTYGHLPLDNYPTCTAAALTAQSFVPYLNPNLYAGGHWTWSTTGAGGATAAGQYQAGSVGPPPSASSSAAVGCNSTSGGGAGAEGLQGSATTTETSPVVARMGGGGMHPGYHCIVKPFDQSHQSGENCPVSDGRGTYGNMQVDNAAAAAAAGAWEHYRAGRGDTASAGVVGPYPNNGYHRGRAAVNAATAGKSGKVTMLQDLATQQKVHQEFQAAAAMSAKGKPILMQKPFPRMAPQPILSAFHLQNHRELLAAAGKAKLVSQGKTPDPSTTSKDAAAPKSSEASDAPTNIGKAKLVSQGKTPDPSTTSKDAAAPKSSEASDASTNIGELEQSVVITGPTMTKETMPMSTIESGAKISDQTSAAKAPAENKEASADLSLLQTPKDPSPKQTSGWDELEASLEEEGRKQREARELRRSKSKQQQQKQQASASSSTPGAGADVSEDYASVIDYTLAKQLTRYDTLGYLDQHEFDGEEESLLRYGDRFGLAVLSEYPGFFMSVPQRPHYNNNAEVDASETERLWDLYMPLVKRGIRAAREGNASDIAAVERVVTCLEGCGFDLRHLKAYMGTARRLRETSLSTEKELGKVDAEIEREEGRIRATVISGDKLLREAIANLEAEKAEHQEILKRIEGMLEKKIALLGEEESIRKTSSTPAMEELLRSKDLLRKRLQGVLNDSQSLGI